MIAPRAAANPYCPYSATPRRRPKMTASPNEQTRAATVATESQVALLTTLARAEPMSCWPSSRCGALTSVIPSPLDGRRPLASARPHSLGGSKQSKQSKDEQARLRILERDVEEVVGQEDCECGEKP